MKGELLMGVISFHDVAKAVLDKQSFENKMLKPTFAIGPKRIRRTRPGDAYPCFE